MRGVTVMKNPRPYRRRNLPKELEERNRSLEKLQELVSRATAHLAVQNSADIGIECFQTQEVAVWLSQNSPEFSQLPDLGRNALVWAIRQCGWKKKTRRPMYGVPMALWVRVDSVNEPGRARVHSSDAEWVKP
jgi:hypothetical protein